MLWDTVKGLSPDGSTQAKFSHIIVIIISVVITN